MRGRFEVLLTADGGVGVTWLRNGGNYASYLISEDVHSEEANAYPSTSVQYITVQWMGFADSAGDCITKRLL